MPPWVEMLTAVLLSAAGLSTAWASYQASLWSGDQISHTGEANGLLTKASQLELVAGQRNAVDMILFVAWVGASNAGAAQRAAFLETQFSPPFMEAFREWQSRDGTARSAAGMDGPGPQRVPVPLYPEAEEAARLRLAADTAFAASDAANQHGNKFVAATVLLSTVLFLGGISQILKRAPPRLAVLGLACLMGLGALAWLATLPVLPILAP